MEITAKKHKRNTQHNIRWITVAIVSSILAISSWAVSSPIGSSPDDDFHLPSIWCGQGVREGLCQEDIRDGWYQIPYTTMGNSACFAFDKDASGDCDYDNSLAAQFHLNLASNLYPPVYYWVMSWMASPDIPSATISIRIFNGILTVLVISLLLFALPPPQRRAPLLALILTSVPLTIFLMGSTNPSAWSYLGLLTFLTAFLGFLSEVRKKPKITLGLIAGLGLLMAVGSRADAAPFAAFATVLAWTLVTPLARKSITNAVSAILIIVAVALMYLRGGTAASVVSGVGLELPQGDRPTPSFFGNLSRLPDLWAGVFGTWELGWLDTPMPAIVWFFALGIYTAVIFSAVKFFDLRQAMAFTLTIVGLVFVPMYILMSNGLSVGEQVQPRYLLPLVVFAVFTALYRTKGDSGLVLSLGQLSIAGGALAIANAVALHTNLRRYLTGLDERGMNLDVGIEWWWDSSPLSPNFVFIVGASSFALFLFSVWKLRHTIGLTDDLINMKQKSLSNLENPNAELRPDNER
jgi:hypothetical protein